MSAEFWAILGVGVALFVGLGGLLTTIIYQAIGSLRREMEARFTGLNRYLDHRFEAIDRRFDGIEKRLDRLEGVVFQIPSEGQAPPPVPPGRDPDK